MKGFRTFLTVIIVPVLIVSTALTLVSGLLRFVVLNPSYYKRHLADGQYCAEMQTYLNEDLSHIAILYGLNETALDNFITETDIKDYTARYVDAVFNINETDGKLDVPAYPDNPFINYILSNTSYDYQAATDFAEECVEAVESDLSAISQPMLLGVVATLLKSELVIEFTALFILLLVLSLGLSAVLFFIHIGEIKRGLTALFGSLFCGATLVFVPLWVFELKGYTERLNLAPSAGNTQLTGILDAFLSGGTTITGIMLLVCLAVLIPCCIIGRKAKRRSE